MNPIIANHIDIDAHTADVIDNAIDDLGARAGLWGFDSEPGHQLYLLGRLHAELNHRLLDTVRVCRAHDFTDDEIGQLLDNQRQST